MNVLVEALQVVSPGDRARVKSKLDELMQDRNTSAELRRAIEQFKTNIENCDDSDVNQEEWLTPNQAANKLMMSRPMLMKLVRDGRFTATKVGAHNRILASDVEEYATARLRAAEDLRDARARASQTRSSRIADQLDVDEALAEELGLR